MSSSSPESLASSFASISLSQARSRSSQAPESSGDEYIILPRPTAIHPFASTLPIRASGSYSPRSDFRTVRTATSGSTSSSFSLVNAQESNDRDENEVEAWLLRSPSRPPRRLSTPIPAAFTHLQPPQHHTDSSSEHDTSFTSGSSQSGSRRSRQRQRARARVAQDRRDRAEAQAAGAGNYSLSSSSDNYEVASSRQWADASSEEEDENEVDSVLGSEFTNEEATSIVDDFLANSAVFMLRGENGKLQLWQALCVELGLCLPPAASSYASTTSSRSRSSSYSSTDSDRTTSRRSVTPTRSTTPTQLSYHPFPNSLTQANNLLKGHAHVNLKDYFETRQLLGDATSSHGDASSAIESQSGSRRSRVSTAEGRVVRDAALLELRFPSKSALRNYTIKNNRFCKLGAAKEAWLQPLLMDMFYRRR